MGKECVATVVAGAESLADETLGRIASLLDEKECKTGRVVRLAANAADVFFATPCEQLPPETTVTPAQAGVPFVFDETLRLENFACDILIQPAAQRRKKLLVADMESTIIEQEMLDELAELIGARDKVADITRRAMNGELDFAAALKERVGLLKGMSASVLDDVATRITSMGGAAQLLSSMRGAGAQAWLVSGGFTCFAKPVAERLGFTRVFANELIVENGMITGDVALPILDKDAKKRLLEQACTEAGITLAESMAVGDGANDVPMLNACNMGGGLGVAFHAKPKVRAIVPHQINHSDLRALMYAQGL